MAFTEKPRLIGTHAWFIQEGETFTSPTAGTVSKTSKPDASEVNLLHMGIIENMDIESTSEEIEVFGPAPGIMVLQDVLETKRQLNGTLKLKELTLLALQAVMKTDKLVGTSAEQFNPLLGKTIKGWLKLQHYDGEDNSEVIRLDLYVHLKAQGISMGDTLVEPSLDFKTLYSDLNTGVGV